MEIKHNKEINKFFDDKLSNVTSRENFYICGDLKYYGDIEYLASLINFNTKIIANCLPSPESIIYQLMEHNNFTEDARKKKLLFMQEKYIDQCSTIIVVDFQEFVKDELTIEAIELAFAKRKDIVFVNQDEKAYRINTSRGAIFDVFTKDHWGNYCCYNKDGFIDFINKLCLKLGWLNTKMDKHVRNNDKISAFVDMVNEHEFILPMFQVYPMLLYNDNLTHTDYYVYVFTSTGEFPYKLNPLISSDDQIEYVINHEDWGKYYTNSYYPYITTNMDYSDAIFKYLFEEPMPKALKGINCYSEFVRQCLLLQTQISIDPKIKIFQQNKRMFCMVHGGTEPLDSYDGEQINEFVYLWVFNAQEYVKNTDPTAITVYELKQLIKETRFAFSDKKYQIPSDPSKFINAVQNYVGKKYVYITPVKLGRRKMFWFSTNPELLNF